MILIAAFIVEGEPIPKQSFRVGRKRGYQPARIKAEQERIGWLAREAYCGLAPSTADVVVSVCYWRKTRRRADLDNLNKMVYDAMKGIVYEDDAQIVKEINEKRVCDGLEPRTCVRVWEV